MLQIRLMMIPTLGTNTITDCQRFHNGKHIAFKFHRNGVSTVLQSGANVRHKDINTLESLIVLIKAYQKLIYTPSQ